MLISIPQASACRIPTAITSDGRQSGYTEKTSLTWILFCYFVELVKVMCPVSSRMVNFALRIVPEFSFSKIKSLSLLILT